MSLKFGKLQQAAKVVISEEKRNLQLGRELTRVLGPTIITTHGVALMAESANDRLDYLEHTGGIVEGFNTSLLLHYAGSNNAEIRMLAARLLPENCLVRFMKDKNMMVRAAAARRLPVHLVETMVGYFPQDENLESIYRQKLSEAAAEDELPDQWYDTTARKIVMNYDGNLERQWEEIAVSRYCASMKSQGVEVDPSKLLDCVYDLLDARDKSALEESVGTDDLALPSYDESVDPVKKLLESNLPPSSYIQNFESLFNVSKGPFANPGIGIGIYENFSRVVAPASAMIPGSMFGAREERALDLYVQRWNSLQSAKGNPYRISWNPVGGNKVAFKLGVN